MFWIETWWRRAYCAVQQWFLHQYGLFVSQHPEHFSFCQVTCFWSWSCCFKNLSLQQICTSDFLLFSTVWGNWCLTVFFIFLSSFSPVPVPDSLGCFIPTSVQLSYSLASSARVMEKHTRLLSGCSFQLIVCSWIVLLRELLPRWTICPFVAGFKNTFGCWSTKAAVQYLLWL